MYVQIVFYRYYVFFFSNAKNQKPQNTQKQRHYILTKLYTLNPLLYKYSEFLSM